MRPRTREDGFEIPKVFPGLLKAGTISAHRCEIVFGANVHSWFKATLHPSGVLRDDITIDPQGFPRDDRRLERGFHYGMVLKVKGWEVDVTEYAYRGGNWPLYASRRLTGRRRTCARQ